MINTESQTTKDHFQNNLLGLSIINNQEIKDYDNKLNKISKNIRFIILYSNNPFIF